VAKHFVEDNIFPGQNGQGEFPYPNTNVSPTGATLSGATFNYSFPYIQPSQEHYGQMRVDYDFSANDSAFIRDTEDFANQVPVGAYPQIHLYQTNKNSFITLAENHIFSPTVLNTARFSFSRQYSVASFYPTPNITDPNVILSPYTSSATGAAGDTSNFGFQVCGCAWGITGITGLGGTGGADGLLIQNIFSYSDDIYWTKGRNAFKFGALLNQYQDIQNTIFQQGGAIASTTLANFAQGIWSSMTTTAGSEYPYDARFYRYTDMGFYAQDDLRATSKLTLNLGLRYEFVTVPREMNGDEWNIVNIATANGSDPATLGGVPSRMFKNPSLHSFSPRIGFAWDPFGKGTMSIRGGAAIVQDIAEYGSPILEEACCQAPTAYAIAVTNNANSNPTGVGGAVLNATVPLPVSQKGNGTAGANGVLYGGTFQSLRTTYSNLALPSPRNVDYYLKQPSMIQYNLTVDKQLPFAMGLSVSYVGSRGYHLPVNVEANFTQPLGYLPNGLPYYCAAAVSPGTDPTCAGSTNPASPYFLHRVNPTLGPMNQYTDRSQSWYNALQVNLNKRVTHGLSFGEALTWSKLLDNGQSQQPGEANSIRIQDPTQPSTLDRGISGFDAAFTSHLNLTYHAPSFTSDKFYVKPLNGWWWSGIWSYVSGYPFEPTITNRDLSANTAVIDRPNLGTTFTSAKGDITGSPSQWFDPTQYSIPTIGTFGNAPRDGLRAPTLKDVDISMVKDTRLKWLGEAGTVQFRAEVFNVLNHPNFGLPVIQIWSKAATTNVGTSPEITPTTSGLGTAALNTAGQISSTNNRSRQIQLALKILF
jgi:hypothetical protein